MKRLLLGVEAAILLLPITAFVAYTFLLTVFLGIPVSIMQVVDGEGDFDKFYPISALGNLCGVFALIVLWSLAIHTVRGWPYSFTRRFMSAAVAGVVASFSLLLLFGWRGLALGVLPPAVLGLHFYYLQSRSAHA